MRFHYLHLKEKNDVTCKFVQNLPMGFAPFYLKSKLMDIDLSQCGKCCKVNNGWQHCGDFMIAQAVLFAFICYH